MKTLISLFFCFICTAFFSQKNIKSWRQRLPHFDQYSAFTQTFLPSGEVDYLSNGLESIDAIFQYAIIENTKKRNKDAYEKSETLMECARIAHENMRHKNFKEVIQIKSMERKLSLILPASITKFKIIRAFAFDLPLLNSSFDFYRDIKLDKDPYQLYKGRRPSARDRASEKYNPEPLDRYTAEGFLSLINRVFKSKKIDKIIRPGFAKYVGYSIRVNPKTMNKSIIPQLEIVVVFGIQQMQKVKK